MNILIPDSWLREFLKTSATLKQIKEFVSLCGPSIERIHEVDGEAVYDVEVTTNRPDSMSVAGVAREASVILPRFGIPAKLVNDPYERALQGDPLQGREKSSRKRKLSIKTDPNLNPRWTSVVLENVSVKPSPKWLADKLEKSGIRALNNIVDITNYLMRAYGQPAHAFDFDAIAHGKNSATMILRASKKGEKLTTLDGKTHTLPGGDIVITDEKGRLIDLCGIMGAKNSSITTETKTIVLFLQTYDPIHIRKTSMALAHRTEAAGLFEKGIDPELVMPAFLEGVRLVGELATTPEGGRNHAMNGVAYRAGRFVGGGLLERSHVEAELRAAAQACGLGEAEIEKVLRVGGPLDVGAANPVEPPPSIAERYERIKFPDAGAAGGNGRSSGAHATGETETESGPEPGQRPGAAPFPLIAVRDISEIITQKWLVHGLIPRFDEGACGYYFAPAKARKSLFLADLALSVATGTPALGRYDVEKPGAVVGFYAEDPKGETSRRVHRLARGRGIEVPGNLYLLDLPALAIDNPEHQSRLLATLLAVPDLALVFLDPMIRLHHANDNKAEELGPIHTFLRTMSRSCAGVVFMLAHHTNKAGDSRGSTEYGAFGDFNLYAAKDADETRVHTVENRGGPAGKPFRYRVEDGTTCAGLPTMRLVASDLNEGEDKAEQDDRGRAAVSEYRTAHPGEPGRVAMRELRKRGLKVASADFWKWWNPPKEGA